MKMCRRTIAIGMAFGMLVTSMPRGVFADEILVEEDTNTIEENIGILPDQEMDVSLEEDPVLISDEEIFIIEENSIETEAELIPDESEAGFFDAIVMESENFIEDVQDEEQEILSAASSNDTVSWNLNADGTLIITAAQTRVELTDFPEEKRQDVRKVILRGISEEQKWLIHSVDTDFPNMTELEYGAYVTTSLADIDSSASDSIEKIIISSQEGGKFGWAAMNALKEINVTGSVEELEACSCPVLESVDIACWTGDTIPEAGFEDDSMLQSVTVHDMTCSEWKVKAGAFWGCANLKSLDIPGYLTVVGENGFCGCSSLEVFPDLTYLRSCGNNAFNGCINLNDVTSFAESVYLGDNCFKGCIGLEHVYLGGCDFEETEGVFLNCASLREVAVGSMNKPASFEGYNFRNCTSLKTLTLPEGIESLGPGEFYNCTNLMRMPDLEPLKTVDGSNTFTDDGTDHPTTGPIFENCSSLKELVFPDEMESWRMSSGGMFKNCISLEYVNLPCNVGFIIENDCFSGCSVLTDIANLSEISCTSNSVRLGDKAFYNCTSLEYLVLPDCVTSLGMNSIPTSIESFRVPFGVKNLGYSSSTSFEDAFQDCTSIVDLTIPQDVTSTTALKNFTNLKYLTIEGEEESFKTNLKDITSLESVWLPDSLKDIPKDMFNGCTSLTYIYLPYELERIGAQAFRKCTSLEAIDIPESVTQIGFGCFSDCSLLETVRLPEGIEEVSDSLFNGCSSLKEIQLPQSIVRIGSLSFRESGLTSIDIPNGVTELGVGAFEYCNGLEYVSLPDDFGEIIPNRLFSNTGLKNLTFQDPICRVKKEALYKLDGASVIFNCDNLALEEYCCTKIKKAVFNTETLVFNPDETETDLYYIPALTMQSGVSYIYFNSGTVDLRAKGIDIEYSKDDTNILHIYVNPSVTSIQGKIDTANADKVYVYGFEGSAAEAFVETSANSKIIFVPMTTTPGEDQSIDTQDRFYEGDYEFRIDKEEAIITKYRGDDTEITIPEKLKNLPVTGIDKLTFGLMNRVRSIHLSKNVRYLSTAAFTPYSVCSSISVDSANPYLSAEDGVLYDYEKKKLLLAAPGVFSVVIPDTVTEIGGYAFAVSKVSELDVPDTVTAIGTGAFQGNLSTVSLGTGITEIPDYLFYNGSIEILECRGNITRIGEAAFERCRNLYELVLPDTVESIGNKAFAYSSIPYIKLPVGLISIGAEAFEGCECIETLDIPDTVQEIGDRAFAGGTIWSIIFGGDVQTLGENLFTGYYPDLYVQPNTNVYEYVSADVNFNLLKKWHIAAKLGHYGVGIKIDDDATQHYMQRTTLVKYHLELTGSVTITDHAAIEVRNADTDEVLLRKGLFEGNNEEPTELIYLPSLTSGEYLPADTEVYFALSEGSLEKEGTVSEEWIGEEEWSKTTFPDYWQIKNDGYPIPLFVYEKIYKSEDIAKREYGFGLDGKDGICFGFSLAKIMADMGLIHPSDFGRDDMAGVTINDYSESLDMTALELIQVCHLMQNRIYKNQRKAHRNDCDGLLNALRDQFSNGGRAVSIAILLDIGWHEITPIAFEELEGRNYATVYCYDSREPDENAEIQINYGGVCYYHNSRVDVTYCTYDDESEDFLKSWSDTYSPVFETGDTLKPVRVSGNFSGIGKTTPAWLQVKGLSEIFDYESNIEDYTRLFWYDPTNGPLTLRNLPDGYKLEMGGEYANIAVSTEGGYGKVTIQSSDNKEETAFVSVNGSQREKVTVEMQYNEDDPARPSDQIILNMDVNGKTTVKEEKGVVSVEGADTINIRFRDGDESREQTFPDLSEYKVIQFSITDDDGNSGKTVEVKVDTDGDGEVDTDITTGNPSHTHVYKNWIIKIPATCTTDGAETGICVCGQQTTRSIKAKGHAYSIWKVTVPATEEAEGRWGRTCSVCSKKQTKIIPKIAVKITIPKTPTLSKLKAAAKGKVEISWKKFKQTKKTRAIWKKVKKVEVQYSTDKTFKKGVISKLLGKKKTKLAVKKLGKKMTYYVRIRYTDGSGGYSAWSKMKKVKTKK